MGGGGLVGGFVGGRDVFVVTTTMQKRRLGRGSGCRNNCCYREGAGTNNDTHTSTRETAMSQSYQINSRRRSNCW